MVPDPTGAQQLGETFAGISGVLWAEPDVQRTLDRMCALLVATVEGCNHAVVTVIHNQHLDSPAASDDVGPAVDAIQFEVDDGPCVQAIREHQTVVTDNDGPLRRLDLSQTAGSRTSGVRRAGATATAKRTGPAAGPPVSSQCPHRSEYLA